MTTFISNGPLQNDTAAHFQALITEILNGLVTQCGVTQTTDICQLTTANVNSSIVVNAQTSTTTLTVNSITSGGNNICIGMNITGTGIPANTVITALGTGTGGTGTYTTNTSSTVAAESMTITLNPPWGTSVYLGYSMLKFNDTLQATAPVFIKLEYGSTTNAATQPALVISVGTGTNGSGTLTGTVGTRVACGSLTASTSTLYNSYFCYNATQGFLGCGLKSGAGGANYCWAGFMVFRTVNGSGATTGDGVMYFAEAASTSSGNVNGYMGALNFNTSSVQLAPNNYWGIVPFNTSTTLETTTAQVFPVWQYKGDATHPGFGITNAAALVVVAECPIGNTLSTTILGSTTLTYINLGGFGTSNLTGIGYSVATIGLAMMWQ